MATPKEYVKNKIFLQVRSTEPAVFGPLQWPCESVKSRVFSFDKLLIFTRNR